MQPREPDRALRPKPQTATPKVAGPAGGGPRGVLVPNSAQSADTPGWWGGGVAPHLRCRCDGGEGAGTARRH